MSPSEPVVFVFAAPVEVKDFHLRRERGKWILAIQTKEARVRFVDPYPLDAAWALFMNDPSTVQLIDITSRQLESYGIEVFATNGEGQHVRILAKSADHTCDLGPDRSV